MGDTAARSTARITGGFPRDTDGRRLAENAAALVARTLRSNRKAD